MDASAPEQEQFYEVDDGRPVNESLLAGRPQEADAGEARKAFADISSNFTEFYAAALAAAQDMKSPPRSALERSAPGLGLGYRYSPAKPPGSAAKRLWGGNELPPLPRPGGTNALRVATALAAARGPQDASTSADGSPTRHAPLARAAPGDGRPPLPSLGPFSAAAAPLAMQPLWAASGGGGGGASRASSLCSNEVPPPELAAERHLSQRTASAGLLCCSGGLSFSAASEQAGVSNASGSGPSGSGPSGSGASSGGSFGAATSSSGGGTSCAGGGARPLPLPMALPMPAELAAAAAAAAPGSRGGAPGTDMDVDVDVGEELKASGAAGGRAASGEAGSCARGPGDVDEVDEADENAGVAGVPAGAVRMGSTVRTLSFNAAEVAERAGVGLAVPPSPFPHLENQPLPEHRLRSRQ